MATFKKDPITGERIWKFNLIPRFNIHLIFQLIALLTSWALHESLIRSFFAFIFGFIYLVAWIFFGDAATKEGLDFIIEYYRTFIKSF